MVSWFHHVQFNDVTAPRVIYMHIVSIFVETVQRKQILLKEAHIYFRRQTVTNLHLFAAFGFSVSFTGRRATRWSKSVRRSNYQQVVL